ncbi:Protein ultraspiracle [Strongyloides ratti]|uniref:Protein ultraspiracle n=1 Tax=Strongyloides ratti TaxID=34506 RepID=A0A090MPF3_STRRB|nr:Protein ultraspiracle [Strongyloides ratti]CEF59987.1 Protein ultraspiracle [Strongyloides ratti]
MASGARPPSNQRSESVPSKSKVRNLNGIDKNSSEKFSPNDESFPEVCVVCGDRACSHYYYGVAACHGCKCFFWRSVKSGTEYKCRYNKNCDIRINRRSACRYCRFQRCLVVGMQVESVRSVYNKNYTTKNQRKEIDKKNVYNRNDEIIKQENTSPLSYNNIDNEMSENITHQIFQGVLKYEKSDYLEQLLYLKRMIENGNNENSVNDKILTLKEIFENPGLLNYFRLPSNYCVKLRAAKTDELNFSGKTSLVMAIDWIQGINPWIKQISYENAVDILRTTFPSLTIIDIVFNSCKATNDKSLLCLPNGITVSKHELIAPNIWINNNIVNNILEKLSPSIAKLKITENEFVLLKALIVLQSPVNEKNDETLIEVTTFRENIESLLYNECYNYCGNIGKAANRFASLLSLLGTISLSARDIVDHIKIFQSFGNHKIDLLFIELFGDIFGKNGVQDILCKSDLKQYQISMPQMEIGVS